MLHLQRKYADRPAMNNTIEHSIADESSGEPCNLSKVLYPIPTTEGVLVALAGIF